VSKALPDLEAKAEGDSSMECKRSEGSTRSQDAVQARPSRVSPNGANVRRLVVDDRPQDDGAITCAWSCGDIGYAPVNAPSRRTRSDRANRPMTDLRTDQGKA
jgi:hypothetical protein